MQQGCSAACREIDKNHVLQHKNKLLVRFLMLLMIKLLHLHSLRMLCLPTDGAWLPVTAQNELLTAPRFSPTLLSAVKLRLAKTGERLKTKRHAWACSFGTFCQNLAFVSLTTKRWMIIYAYFVVGSIILILLGVYMQNKFFKKYLLLVSTIIMLLSSSKLLEQELALDWKLFLLALLFIAFFVACFRISKRRNK